MAYFRIPLFFSVFNDWLLLKMALKENSNKSVNRWEEVRIAISTVFWVVKRSNDILIAIAACNTLDQVSSRSSFTHYRRINLDTNLFLCSVWKAIVLLIFCSKICHLVHFPFSAVQNHRHAEILSVYLLYHSCYLVQHHSE